MKLVEVLRIETQEIATYFAKASLEGKGTPQEISDRSEDYVRHFLRKYFPFPNNVAKGQIIATSGQQSQSIDCVVLNESHPRLLDQNGNMSVLLAEATDIAVEVKSSIASIRELERALEQGLSVKELYRERTDVIEGIGGQKRSDFHHRIPFVIFASKGYADVDKTTEVIVAFYEKNKTPRNKQFDIICINGAGLFINIAPNSFFSNEEKRSIGYAGLGKDTLSLLLYHLKRFPRSQPSISFDPLLGYIKHSTFNYRTNNSFDERLRALDREPQA